MNKNKMCDANLLAAVAALEQCGWAVGWRERLDGLLLPLSLRLRWLRRWLVSIRVVSVVFVFVGVLTVVVLLVHVFVLAVPIRVAVLQRAVLVRLTREGQ